MSLGSKIFRVTSVGIILVSHFYFYYPKVMQFSYHKSYIPDWILKKWLDEDLLEMLWWIKYKNHCKFLMLVKAYNNFNLKKWDLTDWEPYSWFTMKQAAGLIGCSEMTIVRVVKYLYDLWYIKLLKNRNTNISNHVNFYLYAISEKVEEQKHIDLSELTVTIAEPIKTEVEVYTPVEWKFEWDKLETCREFYDRIRISNTKTEISDCKTVFPVDKENRFFSICAHQCDTYFVGWVDVHKKTRCSDMDIVQKKYFALDIDIRQTIQWLTWEVISDNQLYGYIDEILRLLDASDFGDYDEVVMSWNGVHIYYIWEPRKFNKVVYRTWVNKICECIDEILAPLGLQTDKKVTNIASLLRCPWTANYKRQTKYGLDFGQAFVYKRQNGGGITFDSLEPLAAQVLLEDREKEINRKIDFEVIKAQPKKNDWNVFEKINSIPVDSIFSAYTWIQLAMDWKNFISNKDGKYIGCFYNKDKNIIINSWTHYLGSNENSYNTFNYVMREVLWLTHCKDSIKETIEYFKTNYGI